jgi:hypothetical protein
LVHFLGLQTAAIFLKSAIDFLLPRCFHCQLIVGAQASLGSLGQLINHYLVDAARQSFRARVCWVGESIFVMRKSAARLGFGFPFRLFSNWGAELLMERFDDRPRFLGRNAIDHRLTIAARLHQSIFSQQHQLLGCGGLVDLQQCRELADRFFTFNQLA